MLLNTVFLAISPHGASGIHVMFTANLLEEYMFECLVNRHDTTFYPLTAAELCVQGNPMCPVRPASMLETCRNCNVVVMKCRQI